MLITPPVSNCYRNNLNENQLEKMIKLSDSIASRYGSCRYVNMMGDSSFNRHDFYNADHLNDHGAAKLSIKCSNLISESNLQR